MRTIPLGQSGLQVPTIAVGCMRMKSLDAAGAGRFVQAALDLGLNFFDHADIYGGGECESIFGRAYSGPRDKIFVQSKCGIRKGRYDFSKEHILSAVEGSLSRLKTEYLDVLLLHRPDALVEPEEVAEAFNSLHASGKVRHFGVSNQKPMQIELLRRYVRQPLIANQLQLSIAHAGMISNGLHVNMLTSEAADRDGSVLDYCRLHDITVQPWSPFQYGFFEGVFLGSDKFDALNQKIGEVAARHGVSDTTIAIAWLLRHPARMQPVIGTMNRQRLADCCKAADITLTREEWYDVYLAAGNILP